jgi:hypothetical protein
MRGAVTNIDCLGYLLRSTITDMEEAALPHEERERSSFYKGAHRSIEFTGG